MSINNYFEDTPIFNLIKDKEICIDCLYDEGLKKWFSQFTSSIKKHATCSYCNSAQRCITVEHLQQHILKYFNLTPIQEFSPRAEGEYLIKGISSEDWMEMNIACEIHEDLYQDLLSNAVDEEYGHYDWQLKTTEEQWNGCWQQYRTGVWLVESEFEIYDQLEDEYELLKPDYVPASALPSRAILALLKADGFWEMPEGYELYRLQNEICDTSFERLTSAPDDRAGANRFSLAGVSMFYGSPEEQTSALEVGIKKGDDYTSGLFKTKKKLLILDLVNYKKPLGSFDPQWEDNYFIAEFLDKFTQDVSKPIGKESDEEYIPTQAFSDFIKKKGLDEVRKQFSGLGSSGLASLINQTPNDPTLTPLTYEKIDGIRYTSSKNGKEAVVIFCDQQESKEYFDLISALQKSNKSPV